MDENKVNAVVTGLRARGVMAHVERAGVYQFGIRVVLGDGREAVWNTDGITTLDAEVLRDGVLVGFVPALSGRQELDVEKTVAIIAATDYDLPT